MSGIKFNTQGLKRKDRKMKCRLIGDPGPAIGIRVLYLNRIPGPLQKRMLGLLHKAGDTGKVNNSRRITVGKLGNPVVGEKSQTHSMGFRGKKSNLNPFVLCYEGVDSPKRSHGFSRAYSTGGFRHQYLDRFGYVFGCRFGL